MKEIRGVTHFFSETGTEGGHWAVQDINYTGLPPDHDMWHCSRCGVIWYRDKEPDPPPPLFSYRDPDDAGSRSYDHPRSDLSAGNETWMTLQNERSAICLSNGHEGWVEDSPEGVWSYEGLHILRDGDELTVFERDGRTVKWQGVIALERVRLFTEDAFGLWIHSTQLHEDKDSWAMMFLSELPCLLVTNE